MNNFTKNKFINYKFIFCKILEHIKIQTHNFCVDVIKTKNQGV